MLTLLRISTSLLSHEQKETLSGLTYKLCTHTSYTARLQSESLNSSGCDRLSKLLLRTGEPCLAAALCHTCLSLSLAASLTGSRTPLSMRQTEVVSSTTFTAHPLGA